MDAQDLDDLFAMARADAPDASPALMARVLQDALDNQPVPASPRRAPPAKGFWSVLVAAVGGGAGLAGLGSATLAGLFFGLVQPAPLTALTEVLWQDTAVDQVELFPSIDDFLTEG
ncbi:hypothetical protein [Rhodobacter ferrooxidans]|uniref:Dihydroorotate dehydrogenase n=1 Tax=Rhodobacter ferrooxidans TaxID=371731 RepID=C8S053_9RHOB|nr:hypothetical protein [Rhodobacter sp. SW2]EEW25662.1 conserved hypothetical protein [Rhodobacter sp. SW2]